MSLAAVWTGASVRGFGLERLAEWMAAAPARLAGLDDRKGAIVPGRHADLVVFDPDEPFRVQGSALSHRHPLTPWEGRLLKGVVQNTWLRGRLVYDRNADPSGPSTPAGRLL
ncbi:MAG TPA: amidohydrolase family protein [Candidatus Eisenbacteria bacterium]